MPNVTIAELQGRLVDQGFPVSAIAELHTVADCVPIIPGEQVRQRAGRIVELHRQRSLMAACNRVVGAMAVELMDFDGAVGELRAAILEVRS